MFKKIISGILLSAVFFTSVNYAQVINKAKPPKKPGQVTVKKVVPKKQAPKKQASTKQNPKPSKNIFGISKIEFTLKSLNGPKYTSKNVFAENKLTMINCWGTLCNPCIKELPELQKLNDEMKDKKFGIIGIVGDSNDDDSKEEAKIIVAKKGVKFINLIPDEKIQKTLLSKMTGYPVSIFVDSKGNIVGKILTGAKSKEEYKKAAEKNLSTIK